MRIWIEYEDNTVKTFEVENLEEALDLFMNDPLAFDWDIYSFRQPRFEPLPPDPPPHP